MCGIAGVVGTISAGVDLVDLLHSMAEVLHHRGPDGQGIWSDLSAPVGLAHRRLAVIDLTAGGDQPMSSSSGRFVITYNGEIYNYRELRTQLEKAGTHFMGHSDTEVLLELVERHGLVNALGRVVGMYAFGLWDRRDRRLFLARDRIGEKPLYWARIGKSVAFGSELRPILRVPGFSPEIDRGSVALLMRHNYIPAPSSIYSNVLKLAPGTVLSISCDGGVATIGDSQRYWDLNAAFEKARTRPFLGSLEEAADELELLLKASVTGQMISDVRLGAFLSGGIDSSAVVAMMQAGSLRQVETYSIGFHESGFDEAVHAKAVARHIGTRHTEFYVTAGDALDVIPDLPSVFDEPFSDSSQIPTLLVCRLARKHVTVALSGDGGDELFGGYNRYLWGRDLWRLLSIVPAALRARIAGLMQRVPIQRWDRVARFMYPAFPSRFRYASPGERIHKLAELVAVRDTASLYLRMQSHWKTPADLVIGAVEPDTVISRATGSGGRSAFVEEMMRLDLQTYLPDDILTKVDRAAMSASLETRAPFLDHRIVEFAATLPAKFKLDGRLGKRVLRRVVHRHVPAHLLDRPKAGFAMPIAEWLRGPLRDWAEQLLAPSRLAADGLLNAEPIRRAWVQHLEGTRSWAYQLWDVLILQAWLDSRRQAGCVLARPVHGAVRKPAG